MVSTASICDVFVSHRISDRPLASEIADAFRAGGLATFIDADLAAPAERFEDAIWDALAECRAFVIVIPADGPTASMTFELGAAKGWNKPIYGIATTDSTHNLPTSLHEIEVFPKSRIDDLARIIAHDSGPLSPDETRILLDAYKRVGVSCDQLAVQPKHLTKLVKSFNQRSNRQVSGEQLMSALLRLRKRGELPSIQLQPRPRIGRIGEATG
jgi:hypothetical protein